jgi:hypothetical protein
MPAEQHRHDRGMVDAPVPARRVRARACDYCGRPTSARERQQALVSDPESARQRIVTACGADHLQLLIDQARSGRAARAPSG